VVVEATVVVATVVVACVLGGVDTVVVATDVVVAGVLTGGADTVVVVTTVVVDGFVVVATTPNTAAVVSFAVAATVQIGPWPAQAPVQAVNVAPASGVAVNFTDVPYA
jgi:hypothetical protein